MVSLLCIDVVRRALVLRRAVAGAVADVAELRCDVLVHARVQRDIHFVAVRMRVRPACVPGLCLQKVVFC